MAGKHDAVVIGAGHNGLTAGAYLAKSGLDVVVLEARDVIGGLTSTYEIAPGFRASTGHDLCGTLAPEVIADLELTRHGLELLPLDPIAFAPDRSGPGLALWRDPARAVASIREYSAKDAEAYPRFVELVEQLTTFLRPLLSKPPPTPDIRTGADILEMLKLGVGFRRLGTRSMHELLRIVPMAVSDFLDEWFESPLLKGLLAAPALEGICLGPKSAGTAALFLYQRLGERAAISKGGAGALANALAAALVQHGGQVRTSSRVRSIDVAHGKTRGVTLVDGSTVEAPVVLSALSPRATFLELTDAAHLEPGLIAEVENIRYRGVTAKLDLALSALPDIAAGGPELAGVTHVGPDLDALERAYEAAKYDRVSEAPMVQAVIPTLSDERLAPAGAHVMSLLIQYVPYRAPAEDSSKESLLSKLETWAPNLRAVITASHLSSPRDFERELGLPEGNIHHGEMAMDQMFFLRPFPGGSSYATDVDGLFLGGPGCHPGGGVSGLPGANAARTVLRKRG